MNSSLYPHATYATDPQPCQELPVQTRVALAREAGLRVLNAVGELENRLEQVAPQQLNEKEVPNNKETPASCVFEERLREIESASNQAYARLTSLLTRLKL